MLLVCAALLASPVVAQEEAEQEVLGEDTVEGDVEYDGMFIGATVGDVMIVDEAALKRARHEVTEALEAHGYDKKRRRGDRTVYVSETAWKAKVIVDDDGWMIMRRRGVVLQAPDLPSHWWFSDTPLEYLTCVVAPHLCVKVGGLLVSKRRLQAQKGRVVEAMQDELYDY